jgi:hypothetical protein
LFAALYVFATWDIDLFDQVEHFPVSSLESLFGTVCQSIPLVSILAELS